MPTDPLTEIINGGDTDSLLEHYSLKNGVDPELARRLLHQESRGKVRAVSPKGAQGLMQLMPGTARQLGVTDPFDVHQNLDAGTRYLRQQLDEFGDPHLALAAYNAGPGAVKKYGNKIPPYRETQNYVRTIGAGYQGTGYAQDPLTQATQTKTPPPQTSTVDPLTEITSAGHEADVAPTTPPSATKATQGAGVTPRGRVTSTVTSLDETPAPDLRSRMQAKYPWTQGVDVNVIDSTAKGDPSRKLEFYPADETDNPQKGKPTIEVFDRSMGESDLMGEILSHHLPKSDPKVAEFRQRILTSMTPAQKEGIKGDYENERKAGLTRDSFDVWLSKQGGDSFFRGYPTGQWKPSDYTPEQKQIYADLDRYLNSKQGGVPVAVPSVPFRQGRRPVSINPIKNIADVLSSGQSLPRGVAGLQARRYEFTPSQQLSEPVTLPLPRDRTPNEDDVVNAYLSTLGNDYVEMGKKFKAETGHNILTLGGGALKLDDHGNYYIRPTKGAIDFLNAYAKGNGAQEAHRQADEFIAAQNKAYEAAKPDVAQARAAMQTGKDSPLLRGMISGTSGAAQAFGSVLPGSLGTEFERQAAVEKAASEQLNKESPLTATSERIKAGIGGLIPTAAMLVATHKLGPVQLAALGVLEGSTPEERLRGGLQGAAAQTVLGGAPAAFTEAGLPTTGKAVTSAAMVGQPAVEAWQRGESPTQAVVENLPFAALPFLQRGRVRDANQVETQPIVTSQPESAQPSVVSESRPDTLANRSSEQTPRIDDSNVGASQAQPRHVDLQPRRVRGTEAGQFKKETRAQREERLAKVNSAELPPEQAALGTAEETPTTTLETKPRVEGKELSVAELKVMPRPEQEAWLKQKFADVADTRDLYTMRKDALLAGDVEAQDKINAELARRNQAPTDTTGKPVAPPIEETKPAPEASSYSTRLGDRSDYDRLYPPGSEKRANYEAAAKAAMDERFKRAEKAKPAAPPIEPRSTAPPIDVAESPKPPPSTTSARKGQMAENRSELDLPELPAPERKSWQRSLDEARTKGIADAALLADQVLRRPRALNDTETAQLVLRAQEIKNRHAEAMKEIGDATDPATIQTKRDEVAALESEFDRLTKATKASGTEKGRTLAAQKLTINQDYDLVSMVQRAKAAKGRELTTEERQRYEQQAKRITELESQLTEATNRVANQRINGEIKRIQRQTKRQETKAVLDAEFATLKQQLAQAKIETRSGVQGSLLAGLDPEGKLTPIIARMAKNRAKAGINSAEALVSEVYNAVKDHYEVSKEDVAKLIRGTLHEPDDVLTRWDKTRQAQLAKQQTELERRLTQRDFSPRAPRESPIYNRETARLAEKVQKVKSEYDAELERAKPYHWLTNVSGVRKAGMLSGFITHVRNIGGTAAYQAFEEARRIPSVLADAAASTVTGRRTTTLSPSAMLDGVVQAATVGRREAGETLRMGAPREQMERQQLREINTGVKAVDFAFNSIFRFMSASDRVFYQGAYKRNLVERAQAQAITEARKSNINWRERVGELTKKPTAELDADAKHDALVATFNNNNRLSDAIKSVRARIGAGGNFALDIVLPFDRTPTNVIARVLEASPAGYVKNAGQIAKALWRKSFTESEQRAFSETFGRATTGTALITLGVGLAARGLLTTDDYGTTYLNANGRKVNLTAIAPLGTLLGTGAAMFKEYSKETPSLRGYAGAASKPVADQPLLRATSQITDIIQDPERNAAKFTANTAFSFVPFSGAVRMTAQMIDPAETRYASPYSVKEQFQRNIPKWRESLPEKSKWMEKKELRDSIDQLKDRRRKGENIEREIRSLLSQGFITDDQADNIRDAANETRLQSHIKHLSLDRALTKYSTLSESDKKSVRSILERKAEKVDDLPLREQRDIKQRLIAIGIAY